MPRTITNPEGLHDPSNFGYSHVVSTSGDLVFIAGQVGVNPDAEVVSDEFEGQARRAYVNLGTALRSVGLDYSDVVMHTSHIVDHSPDKLALILELGKKYWPTDSPAQTLLGVAALGAPHLLFEVDAVAVR